MGIPWFIWIPVVVLAVGCLATIMLAIAGYWETKLRRREDYHETNDDL